MITFDSPWEILVAVLLVCGAGLSAVAGLGLLRFPDVLTRMHAATKPQVLGLLLALAGLGIVLGEWSIIPLLLVTWLLQLLTAPVSAHLVGRATYRSHHLDPNLLHVDELAVAVAEQQERDDEENQSA